MRRWRDFPDNRGDGATKNQFLLTKEETTQLSRPKRRRATFQTIAETALPIINSSRPRRRRRDFPDQGGDGATKTKNLALRWIRCDFPDQVGDCMTFQIKADTAQFSRQRQRRCNQELIHRERVGCSATLAIRVETAQTKSDTARLSRPTRRHATKNHFLATEVLYRGACSKLINCQNRVHFFSYPTLFYNYFCIVLFI